MPKATQSATGNRRERRKEETGQRLLDEAMRLFARHGVAGTTVEAITEAADVGKGTFFNYFPSKEHVLLAHVQRQLRKLEAAAGAIDPRKSIREQLTRAIHSVADGWLDSPRLIRYLLGAILANETLTDALAQLLPQGRGHVLVLMKEGQRRGELRADVAPEVLARTLQQFMIGTQIIWSTQEGAGLHEWIDQALELAWNGIAAPANGRVQ